MLEQYRKHVAERAALGIPRWWNCWHIAFPPVLTMRPRSRPVISLLLHMAARHAHWSAPKRPRSCWEPCWAVTTSAHWSICWMTRPWLQWQRRG